MQKDYHSLTPEQTVELSNHILIVSQRIYGNNYVDDLSIRIEREQSILNRSIAIARKSEFSRLLTTADVDFYRSFALFADLMRVKSKIESNPEECDAAKSIHDNVKDMVDQWDLCSREELAGRIEKVIKKLDSKNMESRLNKAGVMPHFNDLKSKFLVLTGLVLERSDDFQDVPPPSIAGRRLAKTLNDLYAHVEGYSRLGNREYRMFLKELNKSFEEPVVVAA